MTPANAEHSSKSDTNTSDARACEQLCYAYARCLDFFDHDALPELFSPSAELSLNGDTYRGPQAILAYIAGLPRMPTRHVISNVFIDFIDPENARGIAYVQRLSTDSAQPAHAVGHFEDRYTRQGGEWRFERRTLHWLSQP